MAVAKFRFVDDDDTVGKVLEKTALLLGERFCLVRWFDHGAA